MYICICNQVTETQLRDQIENGYETVRELRESLGVTNQCGKCANCVKTCIKEHKEINSELDTLISSACNA